jgi:hypothetical protein
MMNTWVTFFSVVAMTIGFSNSSQAACEAEKAKYLTLIDSIHHKSQMKTYEGYEQHARTLDTKYQASHIKWLQERYSDTYSAKAKAEAERDYDVRELTRVDMLAQICIYKSANNSGQTVKSTDLNQTSLGKRKMHDPAAEAHECIVIDNPGSGNFGAFKNICGYKVNFYTCNYKPRITQGGFNWSADFDCEKQKTGMHTPGAGGSVAAHNRNTEHVYWFACKAPASPVDVEYVAGKGLNGRCN